MVKQYIYIILLLISISSYAQPPIITNIAASPNAVCPGQQSSTITVNASGNITGYLWSNSMSGNPITVSPTATTTYTVTVTGSGGTASASVMVNVHPVPSVTFLVTPSSNCASNVQFSFTGTSQGNSTYLWNFSDNGSSTLQNPVHTYTNAYGSGTQTVSATLTVTNMYGCTATSTQSFTVNQIPDANLFDVDNISPFSNCDNSPTTQDPNFYIELNNANQSYANSYLVNWGDGNSATYTNSDFPINHTYTQLGAFNLTATATGANLCTNTFSHVVANQSSPNVGIGANLENNNLCWPVTFCFHLNQYQNNSPGTYYVWDFGDGSDSIWDYNDPYIYDSICHTYITSSCGLPGNKFIVSVTAHNECDSSTASINNVRVLELPYADFSVPQYSCVNQNVLFNNTSIHGYGTNCNTNNAFLWKFGDGSTSTLNSPTHTYTTPGNYEITLIVSNTPCGADSIKKNICINPLPVANFTANSTSFCAPDTVSFTNLSGASDFCGNTVYTWSITCVNNNCCNQGCGGYNFTNGTNSDSFNPEINFTQPGIYTVTLTVDNGCNPQITHSVTITVKEKPCANITDVPGAPCIGQLISPGVNYDSCYGGNTSFLWSASGGPIFPNPTAQTPGSISYSQQGSQTITLHISNECDTTTKDSVFIVVPLPEAIATAYKDTICEGEIDTLFGKTSSGLSNYIFSWEIEGGGPSMPQNDTILITPSQSTSYILTIGSGTCSGKDTVTITVIPAPTLTTSPDTSICEGNNVTLTVGGADEYLWSGGQDTSQIQVNPSSTTTYKVTGTDISTGCSCKYP